MNHMREPIDPIVAELTLRRVRYGLTQRELGEAVGVVQSTVHEWETGGHSPSLRNVRLWARVLGVQPVLLDGPTAERYGLTAFMDGRRS